MDTALHGLDFPFVYIDNILVASKDKSQHKQHLRAVFVRLREYGSINVSKCNFGFSQLQYLGYQITKEGTHPLATRVEAILQYPSPKDISELRRFLGIVNFYRRFTKGAAQA